MSRIVTARNGVAPLASGCNLPVGEAWACALDRTTVLHALRGRGPGHKSRRLKRSALEEMGSELRFVFLLTVTSVSVSFPLCVVPFPRWSFASGGLSCWRLTCCGCASLPCFGLASRLDLLSISCSTKRDALNEIKPVYFFAADCACLWSLSYGGRLRCEVPDLGRQRMSWPSLFERLHAQSCHVVARPF